jgi:hypothetical protein
MKPGIRIGETSCRKLTLLDAMVMVAAAAISIYLSKLHHEDLIGANAYEWRGNLARWSGPWLLAYAGWVKGWTVCWLVPLSWAFLVIRLRQPRPRLRRLLEQPGMAALTLAGLLMALIGALYVGRRILLPRSPTYWYVGYRLNGLTEQGGLTVASAWILLALSRRCRPEPGWIDWLGTLLGTCWVASWLSSFIPMILERT